MIFIVISLQVFLFSSNVKTVPLSAFCQFPILFMSFFLFYCQRVVKNKKLCNMKV